MMIMVIDVGTQAVIVIGTVSIICICVICYKLFFWMGYESGVMDQIKEQYYTNLESRKRNLKAVKPKQLIRK